MKRIIIILSIINTIFLFGCKKEDSPGDNFDFSNSIAPYVTIESLDDIEAAPGDEIEFNFQMRTSLQQPVTVTYKMEGAVNIPSGTITIEKEAKEALVSYTIPANIIVPPATSANITFTLVKAQTADGKLLTIGQNADAASQKVSVLIAN